MKGGTAGTDANEPAEIARVDPDSADATLRGAPPGVRRAGAWLAAREASGGLWKVKFAALFPAATLVGGMATALVLENVLQAHGPANVAFGLGLFGVFPMIAYAAWSTRSWAYATGLVGRYRELQRLGGAAAPVATSSDDPLDPLVARIEALAGDDRPDVQRAVRSAHEHARWLRQELAQIEQLSTGKRPADAGLEGAREKLQVDLTRTEARLTALYANLVDLKAGATSDELPHATAQIAAEIEVDANLAAARRQASKQRA